MQLVLATRNRHKVGEFTAMLDLPGVEILPVDAFPDCPEVDEDQPTFLGNAIKKAVLVARAVRRWTLADDSGLAVDALGGRPGVYSARYAGPECDYAANNRKLLGELAGVADRTARFHCVIALSNPAGQADAVEGTCEGVIAPAPRGDQGFGYDPLFIPAGDTRTFAELPAADKNRISHRARALQKAVDHWRARLLAAR